MHKYYSRSPEEFREYAESFNKGRRKKNWIQILILVDIVILVFIVTIGAIAVIMVISGSSAYWDTVQD